MLEFLDELDDNNRAFCYVKTVKPAVLFLELALDLKGLWTKPLQRAFEGVVARAAVEKPPVQKGHCLPLEILEKILHHFITLNKSKHSYHRFVSMRISISMKLCMCVYVSL